MNNNPKSLLYAGPIIREEVTKTNKQKTKR